MNLQCYFTVNTVSLVLMQQNIYSIRTCTHGTHPFHSPRAVGGGSLMVNPVASRGGVPGLCELSCFYLYVMFFGKSNRTVEKKRKEKKLLILQNGERKKANQEFI